MPLIQKCAYADCGDRAYEFETTYYLKFHIISALASLYHLNEFDDTYEWENRYQYFHYYCDHLLFSLGQISNRFVDQKYDKASIKERKHYNRMNYSFSIDKYPLLSNKNARNVIEHIDEYNANIIRQKNSVGGFNVIEDETDLELLNTLTKKKDTHPYTLDRINNKLTIRRNNKDLEISLISLKNELTSLKKDVEYFESLYQIL